MSNRDQKSIERYQRSAIRVLFVPWPMEIGDQHVHAMTWLAATEKTFTYAHYTGKPYSQIEGLGAFDSIHVLGHSSPGCTAISATANDSDHPIDAKTLLLRLNESGMQTEWRGDLKIYACFSCQPSDPGSALPQPPFAKSLSTLLNEGSYKCKVWGYRGMVDSIPDKHSDEGDDGFHRYSRSRAPGRSDMSASLGRARDVKKLF